jgi:hypothetical protein
MPECNLFLPGSDKPCIHYIRDEAGSCGFCDTGAHFHCIEALKSKLPAMSHSMFNAWGQCKMKVYYHNILGISLKQVYLPIAMKMGKIWDRFVSGQPYNDVAVEFALEPYEVAKINGLMRAYKTLGITEPQGVPQQLVKSVILNECVVIGYVDLAFIDGFNEYKLSSTPDFYLQPENIYQQCGLYFLGNPNWAWCEMKVARLPQLKQDKRKVESIDGYEERIYQDVLSRPSYYFQGYNRDAKSYGVRFYRGEFDLGYLEKKAKIIAQEYRETINRESWYRNDMACKNPYECEFYHIKKSGVVSDLIYEYKEIVK